MSIRPIDMQTLLPKLQAMKFAKELEINKHNHDMIAANKEMEKESQEKANQILRADRKEADKLRNDYSEENKSKEKNLKKKKSKKNDKDNEDEKETEKKKLIRDKGNRFDMKV